MNLSITAEQPAPWPYTASLGPFWDSPPASHRAEVPLSLHNVNMQKLYILDWSESMDIGSVFRLACNFRELNTSYNL